MSNLIERYEKERQMESDIRIQQLRIKRLEHQMAYELDPFSPEFERGSGEAPEAESSTVFCRCQKEQLPL